MIETYREHLSANITVGVSDRYTVEYDIPWPKKCTVDVGLGNNNGLPGQTTLTTMIKMIIIATK